MKKKPNIKIGIIINIVLNVLSIVYLFLYYIEKTGFELNYISLELFIYLFIFYIFPFIIWVNLLFFLFYSFFYKWARIGLVITLLMLFCFIYKNNIFILSLVYEKETDYLSRNCYKFDSLTYQFLLRYKGTYSPVGLS